MSTPRPLGLRSSVVALLLVALTMMSGLLAPAPASAEPPPGQVLASLGVNNGVTREVQGFLRTLGFYPYEPDGNFGPVTKQAVERFQKWYGSPVTGTITIVDYRQASRMAAQRLSETGSVAPAPTPDPAPANPVLAYLGVTTGLTREVQGFLYTLNFFPYAADGYYGPATKQAVEQFQKWYGSPVTGTITIVDYRQMARMAAQNAGPAPAPAAAPSAELLAYLGVTNGVTREVQTNLNTLGFYPYPADGNYGAITKQAVERFQRWYGSPVTGTVTLTDYRQIARMAAQHKAQNPVPTNPGVSLDSRCLTGARVLCIDKSARKLYLVEYGSVTKTMDARFGGPSTPTREGQFSVLWKSRDHHSTEYNNAWMPFALFFSGGQAVHYSPGFANVGWAGASKGCVNLRDFNGAGWLFDYMRVGDKVIVYRS